MSASAQASRSATETPADAPHFIVLGAGGLGCPALLGLSAAGAPTITVVDDDFVDASNLQRQVLFQLADVGATKVDAAAYRLRARRPELEVRGLRRRIDEAQLASLLDDAPERTVVLECTDDPALKFLVNDACVARGVSFVVAGVIGWRGQAMACAPGHACFRCVYESPPPPELAPACSAVGIIGATAGHLGYLMAMMAIHLAAAPSASEPTSFTPGTLISIDLRTALPQTLRPQRRRGCTACACAPETHSPRLATASQ